MLCPGRVAALFSKVATPLVRPGEPPDFLRLNGVILQMFIHGVTAAALFWFVALAYAVGRRGRQFSTQTLLRMEHFSGVLLLIVAATIGIRIIIILHQSH